MALVRCLPVPRRRSGFAHREPRNGGVPKCSHPRVKDAFLVVLDMGSRIADEIEGGCHEAMHFGIDRGALRCALSYSRHNP